MNDFSILNGFNVKDPQARANIDYIIERLGQLYNPNLLINGGFQVWQRGETKRANLTQSPFYLADRWQVYSSSQNTYITCSKNGYGMHVLVEGNETCKVRQIFENPLPGGDYTISFNVVELSGNVKLRYFNEGVNQPDIDIVEGINTVTINVTSLDEISFFFYGASTLTLNWVKLEAGRIATQYVPEHYQDVLVKCKRYYQKTTAYEYFGPIISMGSGIFRCSSTYHGFRENPTVKFETDTKFPIYNYTSTGESVSPDVTSIDLSESGNLKVTTNNTSLPLGTTGIAQLSKVVEFDAEIY